MIDPGVTTLIQTTFLQHIQAAYSVVTQYALNLLYIFAVFEMVIFGLLWALQQGTAWEQMFFKVIKIGLIFFIVQNYSFLMNTIIQSFAQIGGAVVNAKGIEQYIFDPAKIWQYGYDVGLNLLKIAATTGGVGLAFIYVFLGMGILLIFGLLGIQIILQVVGFYLIALIALIMMPFGAFSSTFSMFDGSVQAVLKAGVRLMVLIIIVGIAVTVWQSFHLQQVESPYQISVLLGLFFSSLVFLYSAIYLPKVVSEVIGNFSFKSQSDHSIVSQSVSVNAATSSTTSSSNLATVEMASNIDKATAPVSMRGSMSESHSSIQGSVAMSSAPMQSSTSSNAFSSFQKREGDQGVNLYEANKIAKSISDQTVKKIETSLKNILKMQDTHDASKS